MSKNTAVKATDTKAHSARSLVDYARAKRKAELRATCKVCALPDEVRTQTKEARDKKIDVRTIREWLHTIYRIQISDVEYRAHGSGLHAQRDE